MIENFIRRNEQDSPYLEIEKFRNSFDTFFNDFESYSNSGDTTHFAKIFEEKEFYFLATIDMPGVNRDDIEIIVEDDNLIVNANRNEEYLNFDYSTSIMIPTNIHQEKIKALFENGVLRITLPKESNLDFRNNNDSKKNKRGVLEGLFSKDKKINIE